MPTHKYENKEKDPRLPSTSHRNSIPQNKKKKCTKSKPEHSKDDLKHSKTLFYKSKDCKNKKCRVSQSTSGSSILTHLRQKLRMRNTELNAFERISGNSQNYVEQICTCHKKKRRNSESGSFHGHANSQNVSTERSKRRRRKKLRRRHKKASKRESNRLRHDCFMTLCVCIRGRSSDELRACKCTSSHQIPSSDHECCCVKTRRKKRTNHSTPKNILRNDIRTGKHTVNPSTNERECRFKLPDELLQEKTNTERNVIIKGLNTIRKGINRFSARTIRLFKFEN
ncbi:uncharacterized protein [Anoplolepis gracilipes]|uniref:uncharacterized protein n=1 Tax=Anoplolepis gracilipes TaxID=354296 RepID=UPI003BA03C26